MLADDQQPLQILRIARGVAGWLIGHHGTPLAAIRSNQDPREDEVMRKVADSVRR